MSLARTPIYLSHLRSSQHHILLPCSSRQNMALDGPSQFEKVNKTLGQTPGIHIFLQKVFNKFIQLPALLSFIASGQTLWRFSCSSSSKLAKRDHSRHPAYNHSVCSGHCKVHYHEKYRIQRHSLLRIPPRKCHLLLQARQRYPLACLLLYFQRWMSRLERPRNL